MKKIQNGRILTNQQMKHISGGFQWQTDHGTLNGGGTCPPAASKEDCTGKCDLPNNPGGGSCGIYVFSGREFCACIG